MLVLSLENLEKRESNIVIINGVTLDAQNNLGYALRPGFIRYNYISVKGGGGCCCGSRSVNVHFETNFATSLTAVRV